jgi:uncharacterized membrane protein (DUF2068 family)
MGMRLNASDPSHHRGLCIVAIFEALKGSLVLIVGFALLSFIHQDLEHVAEKIVKHLHLNPASRVPRIFAALAERTTDSQLVWIAAGALLYSAMRFIEAYGLWHNRIWAEWFALVTSGMFLPVELFELIRKPTWVKFLILAGNAAVVLYLSYALRTSARPPAEAQVSAPSKS